MVKKKGGRRKRVAIGRSDVKRILAALERYAKEGSFEGLRTRALIYLLLDGGAGANLALWLNCEEVVVDSGAVNVPRIVRRVVQRSCEANSYSGRDFSISERVRGALLDYLKVARREGKIAGDGFTGPLFSSVTKIGKRISRHTAMATWRTLLADAKVREEYILDDVVYSGKLRFLEAADGNSELLSSHAGISEEAAATYRDAPESSVGDVLARMDKKR